MQIDSSSKGRIRLCERFEKIQNAQRALHPLTIKLLNESRGIFGQAAKVNGVVNNSKNNSSQQKNEPLNKAKKTLIANKIKIKK